MLIMVAGVTVFAEGLAGNVQKARAVSSEGPNTDTFEGFGMGSKKITPVEEVNTTFEDVKGCDEVKEELQEIILYLRDPDRFTRLGAKLPKGVMMSGSPGTGKTLLARAIAGEAGVPFLQASGSEFEEMFVGVGARRIRDLFQEARKHAPCIVFIDEIDAVGSKRSNRDNTAVRMTLNQLLVEMDGFENNNGVVVICATNFPESLDKALTRPGRLDRQIVVPIPDLKGRTEILEMYAAKLLLDEHVDLRTLARRTAGMTGADLANILNIAAVRSSADNLPCIPTKYLEEAFDRVVVGLERRNPMSEQEKTLTAYHEGGHTLVSIGNAGADPVHKATIMPRGNALGVTWSIPEREKYSERLFELQARLDVLMGGKAAEELIFGPENVTAGCTSDLILEPPGKQPSMAPPAVFEEEASSEDAGDEETSNLLTVTELVEEEGRDDMGIDDHFRSVIEKLQAVCDIPIEELVLPPDFVHEIQETAETYIKKTSSTAFGDVVYDALLENVPYARKYFVTPRPILVLRLADAVGGLITRCGEPAELKRHVETLAFQHLEMEVTAPRFDVAREGILNTLQSELGSRMTTKAHIGFQVLLNYLGSACLYVRREYGQRVRTILRSWRTANAKAQIPEKEEDADMSPDGHEQAALEDAGPNSSSKKHKEMFLFNAAVMGFGESDWMNLGITHAGDLQYGSQYDLRKIILRQFDAIATGCANSFRLQEECDVLSLVLAKCKDMKHEAAWNWLWETVETSLKANKDKPKRYEQLLSKFLASLEEEHCGREKAMVESRKAGFDDLGKEVYTSFFELAPSGQDLFKQSSTRLFFIADKIIFMTLDIFRVISFVAKGHFLRG
ncbi:FTSH5 [Symbiodinium natans]|uniref:FTSH5 protein n=1 Tax=Symbiodinium natans TaxID=878477 RepID=A0A812N426_9DINO|nr:FTSH5 [Symbiodinium natans]